jgi:hypothetical protein
MEGRHDTQQQVHQPLADMDILPRPVARGLCADHGATHSCSGLARQFSIAHAPSKPLRPTYDRIALASINLPQLRAQADRRSRHVVGWAQSGGGGRVLFPETMCFSSTKRRSHGEEEA